jgi:hypothetical protein
MNFQCCFCDRAFQFKEVYENHKPVCEFFYRKNHEKIRDDEKLESLPPLQDMFQLIRDMYADLQKQKAKIENLEKIIKQRRKTNFIESTPVPIFHFRQWVRQIEVNQEHLSTVFKEDIFEGIRKCIERNISEHGIVKIPVRTLLDKPNGLYVYKSVDGKNKWILCEPSDILYLVEHIMSEFMRIFCDWEDENREWISKSIENKDLHVNYLCKITGSMIYYKDRKRQELKQWLCQRVVYDI